MKEKEIFDFNGMGFTVVDNGGEPWFVAKDVCDILGLSNVSQALSVLYTKEISDIILNDTSSNGVIQDRTFKIINEEGLYRLIFKSRKKAAKEFQDWVFSVVLPSIRKTGGYISPDRGNVDIEEIRKESKERFDKLREIRKENRKIKKENAEIAKEMSKKDEEIIALKYLVRNPSLYRDDNLMSEIKKLSDKIVFLEEHVLVGECGLEDI